MTEIFYKPFEYIMRGSLAISGNYYVIALFFFALIVQIILLPLAIKQHKSQIMQRKLRPKEMAIRKKYAGRTDKVTQQKMQMEIQEMYKDEGFNQFAGCLPMLIQLPIILILFAIVRNPITYSSTGEMKDRLQQGELYKEAIEIVEQYIDKDLYEAVEGKESSFDANYKTYEDELKAVIKNLGGKEATVEDKTVFEYDKDGAKNELILARIILENRELVEVIAASKDLDLVGKVEAEKGFSETDKESLPIFTAVGINMLDTPSFGDITSFNLKLILLIPLLIFITSYIGGRINRKYMGAATDPSGNPMGGGKFMEWGMPAMSTVFSFSFPAAVGVYWIWRTVVGAIQPVILNKFYPLPEITQEQIDAAEREARVKKKKKVIMIEVDEDDDSYRDIEVRGSQQPTITAEYKQSDNKDSRNKKSGKAFKVNNIEMLSADDDIEE